MDGGKYFDGLVLNQDAFLYDHVYAVSCVNYVPTVRYREYDFASDDQPAGF